MEELTSALWSATLKDDNDRAIQLICSGANVNKPINTDFNPVTTLLHYATMKKDIHRMLLLIYHGAYCNARDYFGRTPLHWAVSECIQHEDRPDIVEVLINGGASVDVRNSDEFTPFLLAARDGFCQSAEKLIDRGASLEAVNLYGLSALHLAVEYNNWRMIKMLLVKFGADIHVTNHVQGKTALQMLNQNRPSSRAIVRIIIREAVKRESLGQRICEKYRQMAQSCEEYSQIDQECREEIERMRSERIVVEDSTVSFFDIFSMNEEKLAALARNKNVVTEFETSAYLELFGIYAVDLATKVEKAKLRANFLISAEDFLSGWLGDVLPAPILRKMATYVEDDDTIENKWVLREVIRKRLKDQIKKPQIDARFLNARVYSAPLVDFEEHPLINELLEMEGQQTRGVPSRFELRRERHQFD